MQHASEDHCIAAKGSLVNMQPADMAIPKVLTTSTVFESVCVCVCVLAAAGSGDTPCFGTGGC